MNEKGSALISVLLFITVVAIISVPLFNSVLQDRTILEIENTKSQNHYAVESALELVKSARVSNPTELSNVITTVNNLNLENVVDVPVELSLNTTAKKIVISSDSNRSPADIEGEFSYVFGDLLTSNLFVTPRMNHSPGQTVHITPRCNSCSTRSLIENLGSYLTIVNPQTFDDEMTRLVGTFDTSIPENRLTAGTYTYTHIKSNTANQLVDTNNKTKDLKINGDVIVNGNLTLKKLKDITIDGDVHVFNGDFIAEDLVSLKITGNLIVRDKAIEVSNVTKFTVDGRVIAWDTIDIKNTGGGNNDNSGVIIDTINLAAGGFNLNGKSQIISVHAHGSSSLFHSFFNTDNPATEDSLIITNWDVGNK